MKEKIQQLIRYHHIKHWYEKYERLLIPLVLLFGVVTDGLMFKAIEVKFAFVWLGTYIVLAAGMILFMQAYDAGRVPKHRFWQYLRLAAPLIIQFTFGALLNASFVFYLFSGSLAVSWPFFVLLLLFMVSNDIFRKHYQRPVVQIGVYFFLLFSFTTIFLPFAWNKIGPEVFLTSGAISLSAIAGYVVLLGKIIPILVERRRKILVVVLLLFASLNALYFLHLIPPIPLALKDTVVAHDLRRVGNAYQLQVEDQSWWNRLTQGEIFHQSANGKVVLYTSIFAPEDFSTTIVHQWQQYDEVQKRWVNRDRLSYTITGGLSRGYRGYTTKSHIQPGRWRVSVETPGNQVLGRVSFHVLPPEGELRLVTVEK